MNDITTAKRALLQALDNQALSKTFRKEIILCAEDHGQHNPYSEEEQVFLKAVSAFIKVVGHEDFGKMLRIPLDAQTPQEATFEFHKGLRVVDAFALGKGYADVLLYTMLNLPESSGFWSVFTAFFFPGFHATEK